MLRHGLVSIYRDAVRSLAGDRLVRNALAGVPRPPNLTVLALGKAAAAMLRGAAEAWGPLRGVAVGRDLRGIPEGVEAIEGEHPVPGPGSLRGGRRLLETARSLGPADFALVLLSGGGSALAELPAEGLTLDDLRSTTELLLGSGVPIDGINAVRKRLSQLKGGRLGAACGAGRVLVLAISDVPGDDPAVIASGPFAPDPTMAEDALAVLTRHRLLDRVPQAVLRALEAGDETPKPGDPHLARIESRILVSPLDLPKRAVAIARERGFAAAALPELVQGDVHEVARRWADWFASRPPPGTLLAAAAEPTVELPSDPGEGGRSQHLALLVAERIRGRADAACLAAGSDGLDGASRQAGAAVDGTTWRPHLAEALRRFDTGPACRDLGIAIPAWETGTNLADLHLLAIAR